MSAFKVFMNGKVFGSWTQMNVENAIGHIDTTDVEVSSLSLVLYDRFNYEWTVSDYVCCGTCEHRMNGKCMVANTVYNQVAETFTGCMGEFWSWNVKK
jgi:hypothetical protein